jgi:signal transduction histidine kinase
LESLDDLLRRSRARLIDATDAERRRIERNLHDGAQQQLVTVALKLNLLRPRIASDPAVATALIDEAVGDLMQSIDELRSLAVGVHPPALAEGGLATALTTLAERAPLPVDVVSVPDRRLPRQAESTVYFVVAEALTNVAKHAQAGNATVDVSERDDVVTVEIRDDGIGGADPRHGSGLSGLTERVAALDGHLDVVNIVGGGTLVRAVLRVGGANACAECVHRDCAA